MTRNVSSLPAGSPPLASLVVGPPLLDEVVCRGQVIRGRWHGPGQRQEG